MRRATPVVWVLAALGPLACDGGDDSTIEVVLIPERQWYHTDQEVMVAGFVRDGGGRAIAGAEVSWSADPPSAAAESGSSQGADSTRFLLQESGIVTLTGCRSGRDHPCASVTVRVDDGSPALEIASPRPGEELDGADGIAITGSVADAGNLRVFVAGQLLELDDLGQFATTVPADFGENHIAAIASDGITPESSVQMDVLWAPSFAAAVGGENTPELTIENGVALSLGQALFDDGLALDLGAGNQPVTTYDLADVFELLVGKMAIADKIPDPVLDESALFLRIPTAEPGPIEVSIDITPEGLDLFVQLPALTLTTDGQLLVDDTMVDLEGSITASVAGSASIEMWHVSESDPIHVELTDLLFAIETAQGDFSAPEAGAIFRVAQSLLRTTIEERLVDAVQDTIADGVPELLSGVLEGLDTGLSGIEVTLDNDVFSAPVTLTVDGRLRSAFARPGIEFLSILRTRIGTLSQAVFPDTRGVPLLEPIAGDDPTFFRDRELQVGVRLALLNGLLHSLWNSGLFEIDLTDRAPGDIKSARLSSRMPPVLRPPRPGVPEESADAFVLSLGQVEIELDLGNDEIVRFGVGLATAIDVAVTDDAIVVDAPDDPRIRIWTIRDVPGSPFQEDLVRALLLEEWPAIRDTVLSGLHFELPLPDTSGLTQLAPDLSQFTLSVEPSRPVYLRRGYLMLEGAFRGNLPAAAALLP